MQSPALPSAALLPCHVFVLTPTAFKIREMILRGELEPGQRVREAELAERLATSRMPVRQALPALLQEGLIVKVGQRGFAIRTFTQKESMDALRLRAVLEGWAARQLAERGAAPVLLTQLRGILAEGDRLFAGRRLADQFEGSYGQMNRAFHDAVVEGAGIPLLENFAGRCRLVPFVSPETIAFADISAEQVYDLMFVAHQQHHALVDAIETRQADRAEFLFREHAIGQERSMQLSEKWQPA